MARSGDKTAFEQLNAALNEIAALAKINVSPAAVRRLRDGLARHAELVEQVRAAADPIYVPTRTFDPSDPKIVGLMVSLALLAQPRLPLAEVRASYGSGVYAIYYHGAHPLYERITNTETPIYVGKADPANSGASTPREQGSRLTSRLMEHANTIKVAEEYAATHVLPEGIYPLRLREFTFRRLVCATNAQLVAERHLIQTFWPLWNSDTKACWGMSKHGDSAGTRKNKRSPWDVVHPGRLWALDEILEDKLGPEEILQRVNSVLDQRPPYTDHAGLLEEMLAAFQQDDALSVISPLREDAERSGDGTGESEEQ